MSLINETLKNLDDRKQSEIQVNKKPVPFEEGNAIGEAESSIWSSSRFLLFVSLSIFAAIVTVAWKTIPENESIMLPVALFAHEDEKLSEPTNKQIEIASVESTAPTEIIGAETVPVLERDEAAIRVESERLPQQDRSDETDFEKVGKLLVLAESALENNRLTLPESDNALFYLNKILSIDHDNGQAKIRFSDLQKRYAAFVEKAIDQGDADRTHRLLKRAESLNLTLARKTEYEKSIKSLLSSPSLKSSSFESLPAPLIADASHSKLTGDKKADLPSIDKGQLKAVNIVKSPDFRDQEVAMKAKSILSQGNYIEGVKILTEYIASHEDYDECLVTLFEFYIETKDYLNAKRQIEKTDSADLNRYMLARIKLLEGNSQASLSILASGLPSKRYFERYNSFYAALLQNQKKHEKSADLYRQLIINNSNNSSYWLGLAVSSDSTGMHSEALQAYKKVVSLGGQNKNVMTYAQSRIKQLAKDLEAVIAGDNGFAESILW